MIGAVVCIPIAPSRPTPACKFNRWTGHPRVYKVCAHEKLPTGIGCRIPERRADNAPHQAAISKAYASAGSQLRPPRPLRRGPGPPPPPRIGSSAGVGRRAGEPPGHAGAAAAGGTLAVHAYISHRKIHNRGPRKLPRAKRALNFSLLIRSSVIYNYKSNISS